ncbi:BTAD domain-containing putative transcriptional regulator [Amycolatopsis sp. 195334CR]|uniref:AfsR/SARP family transcriptional regulator n=1 Tax=Amycolatopsis sp. 195334CR TaxID=2814588 RepID=UPI001A8C0B2A|nr:BTAD domain-containing putative transcriptional regulator [Amycolatopsis sp. 195334CR]MBN6042317.1 tetratricopeptide repeat protein [Amycolatopsis sp. 195334CR]
MTTGLRLSLLGPPRAWRGSGQLDLGHVLQQAVLAALVLRPDLTVSRRELLDGVWGDEPPGTGVKVLPGYVFRLRKSLRGDEPVIDSDRGGYRFVSRGAEVDVARLEPIVAEAGAARQAGDLTAAVGAYARALDLFTGEPLAGLPGPFAEGQRRRLTERRTELAREKLDGQIRLGWYADSIDELAVLIAANPYSEPLVALQLRALYGSGRQADALAALEALRRRLIDDLGLEPGEQVRRVQEAVLRGDDELAEIGERPAHRPVPPRRIRDELPNDLGELTGRERELAALTAPGDQDAVEVRVVDGVAGAGKTALVVRAARSLRERCPDGSLYVTLHGHSDGHEALEPARVLRRLLRAVGADDTTPDDLDELAASWRAATASLRLLLVLDDAAGAEQVRPLLPAGPGSRVLVTSRRRLAGLDVTGRVSLGPLDPDQAEDLLHRLVGGSRAAAERDAVRELARLCGRLPLALRIAGSRLQNRPMWTFEYLVSRLADDGNRLGELTAEDRSVETAFRLSYHQLPAGQRRAFRALGLATAAELDELALSAVLGRPLAEAGRLLEHLVDVNLVQETVPGRYRLHDLVAVYARRLAAEDRAEADAVRAGLFRLHLAAVRCAGRGGIARLPAEPGPFERREDALAWLDTAGDLADVVAHAAGTGHPDLACRLAEGAVDYLVRRGRYHECRAAIEAALPVAARADDPRTTAILRFCLGYAHLVRGEVDRARACFAEGQGDRGTEARARGCRALIDGLIDRNQDVAGELAEVLALAVDLDDDWLAERATSTLGYLHLRAGRPEEALEHTERARVLGEKLENPHIVGEALCHIGSIHLHVGRFAEAAVALRESVELAERISDLLLLPGCLTRLGTAEEGLGHLGVALDRHHQALGLLSEQYPALFELEIRVRLGNTYLAAGQPALARRQFEVVLAREHPANSLDERQHALDGLDRCAAAEAAVHSS